MFNCSQTASALNSTSCPVVCHLIRHSTNNIWSQVSSTFPALYIIFTCLCTSASVLICNSSLPRFSKAFRWTCNLFFRHVSFLREKHMLHDQQAFIHRSSCNQNSLFAPTEACHASVYATVLAITWRNNSVTLMFLLFNFFSKLRACMFAIRRTSSNPSWRETRKM